MNDLKTQLAQILTAHVRLAPEVYTEVQPSEEQLEKVIETVKEYLKQE